MSKVLYTGSFDPLTRGHMDIIEQASKLFDEVIVAVLKNTSKKANFFTIEERVEIIKEIYKNAKNVKIITGDGAAVDIALNNDCKAIVRGLRGVSDYDYEAQLANINKDISNNKINTVCLFSNPNYQFISSSAVKEVFNLNKDISKYVDPLIEKRMFEKKGENK